MWLLLASLLIAPSHAVAPSGALSPPLPFFAPPSPGDPAPPAQPPRKYLLAYCLEGRLSNQMWCMRNYLLAAQALGRTLLVPTHSAAYRWGTRASELDYTFRWDVAVDWRRMQGCLAPDGNSLVVVTLEDYLALENETEAVVGYFSCAMRHDDGPDRSCYGVGHVARAFQRLHSGVLRVPAVNQVDRTPQLSRTPQPADFRRWYGHRSEKIICLGEMFPVDVIRAPEPAPRAPWCQGQYLWMPHPAIVELVQGIQKNVIGQDYWAVHLRRGDFYEWWLGGAGRGGIGGRARHLFPPLAELAAWIRSHLEGRQIFKLFIATNAGPVELDVFRTIVQDPMLPALQSISTVVLKEVMRNRTWLQGQPWAAKALSLEEETGRSGIVPILADVLLCAGADRFLPSFGSTFSAEIKRIRRATGKP